MKELTAAARQCLDDYLQKVRTRLSFVKSLDSAEIERDICEHIERELDQAGEPVECDQVQQVLERLGAPEHWAPDEELNWWRKIIVRMQSGPDDWRLAYICLGLFVLGLVILPIGIFLIPLSFYIARSAISLAGGIDKLKEQKILIYPSLVFFYICAALIICFWPTLFFTALNDDYWWFVLTGLGLWWILLGVFLRTKPTLTDKLIYPFGPLISKKIIRNFTFTAIALLVISTIMAVILIHAS